MTESPTDSETVERLRNEAETALGELLVGNRRFADGGGQGHSISPARRAELLEGQQQVSMDVDGSGSSQVLTPEQRQQQLAQARERVAFYCR